MKVVFNTHLAGEFPQRIAQFASQFPDHRIITVNTKDELLAEIRDAHVLVDYRADDALLDSAPELQWMFVPFTGVDGIPRELLRSRGIRVSNNHGNASVVAERAVSMALAVTGRVVEFDRGLRRGFWFRRRKGPRHFDYWTSISNLPAVILGTGAIGLRIAELLMPFSANITGVRRSPNNPAPHLFRRILSTADTAEALKGARLCFITLPLSDQTRSLIGEAELELLRGAYLINVSRGEIVDEAALFQALSNGTLAGAALDVWHRYPKPFYDYRLPSKYPFHTLENVVLSPHAGSSTAEGKLGQLEGTLANLKALFETGTPIDIPDTE